MDEIASDTLFFAGTPETIRINSAPIWRSAGGAFRVQARSQRPGLPRL